MKVTEVISALPIDVEKSVRGEEIRVLTSCRAGKIVPVAAVPLLREDRVASSRVRVKVKMEETVHPLMNAVNLTVMAHFIPFLALEGRFDGLEQFNRSYKGINEPRGTAAPIPFFNMMTFSNTAEFWKTLGVHWVNGAQINDAFVAAYNTLVNFRRKARSEKIGLRTLLDTTLAQAFWKNPILSHIVPDFDSALIDGQVALDIINAQLPVKGLGHTGGDGTALGTNASVRETGGATVTYPKYMAVDSAVTGATFMRGTDGSTTHANFIPAIFAELEANSITVSLANIEMAKKTAAFARLREQYAGMDDDYLVDLLMQGIRVPEEAMKQPILLDRQSTIFGLTERYATDGANLDKSVTNGFAEVTLNMRTPAMNTGGIILITAEIVPEQLFERMEDVFLAADAVSDLPDFIRDFLDPEKVEVVPNRFVDVLHSTPAGVFGYAPLNHRWKRSLTRIGGRYYRPNVDTFIEDRQRFWSVEKLNPALTTDFYLVPSTMSHSVFADSAADPFEILALGGVQIVGNTVFGQVVEENRGDYAAIDAKVDKTQIVQ